MMNTPHQQNRQVYHIVPNPMYGWDFKIAGENTIIKFGHEREDLRLFAKCYCKNHACDLVVYNYIGEVEDIISFQGE